MTVQTDLICKTAESQDLMTKIQFAEEDQERRKREIASIDLVLLLKLKEFAMVRMAQTCKTAECLDPTTKTQSAEEDQVKKRKETVWTDQEPSLKIFHFAMVTMVLPAKIARETSHQLTRCLCAMEKTDLEESTVDTISSKSYLFAMEQMPMDWASQIF